MKLSLGLRKIEEEKKSVNKLFGDIYDLVNVIKSIDETGICVSLRNCRQGT